MAVAEPVNFIPSSFTESPRTMAKQSPTDNSLKHIGFVPPLTTKKDTDTKALFCSSDKVVTDESGQETHLFSDQIHVQELMHGIGNRAIDFSHISPLSLLQCAESNGMANACVQALTNSLSGSNCIRIRQAAVQSLSPSSRKLVLSCDAYLKNGMDKMLSTSDFLTLPRIQVNVNVSEHLLELSTDTNYIEEVCLQGLVENLEAASCSISNHYKTKHLEESLVEMHLMSDGELSVEISNPGLKPQSVLSPEKPLSEFIKMKNLQPTPRRKLEYSNGEEGDELEVLGMTSSKKRPKNQWKIVAVEKMSEISAICLVDRASTLVVLNINLVISDSCRQQFPASPTTGLPFTTGNALVAQMGVARCGFGSVLCSEGNVSVGGFNREGILGTSECYNIRTNTWVMMGDLCVKRARFSAVECRGVVYAIGGSDGRMELGSMEMLNSTTNTWEDVKSRMITPRSSFGAASLNGSVYAIGGSYYSIPLKTAEVFDPQTRKWKALPPMKKARNGVSVASCNGKIYAIGGQMPGWSCLACVECYDPVTKKWTEVASMKTPRRNATVVNVDDKIYVIGGYNGSSALNLVEVYDPLKDEWTCSKPMQLNRSGASALYVDGSIYVTGGFSGLIFFNSVERFDLHSNEWSSYI